MVKATKAIKVMVEAIKVMVKARIKVMVKAIKAMVKAPNLALILTYILCLSFEGWIYTWSC